MAKSTVRGADASSPSQPVPVAVNGDGASVTTKHTISVLVENRPGALAKVAEMFRRRGHVIHSFAVGGTEDPSVSRMIVLVDGAAHVEQVVKNLNKILEVIKVNDLTGVDTVDRELALIKVNITPGTRREVVEIAEIFRASVVDISEPTMTLEVTGRPEKIDALQQLLTKHGIREMVRTGQVTLVRGPQST